MTQEGPRPTSPAAPGKPAAEASQYLSTRGLVIVFAGLALALVLGYLLLDRKSVV